MIFISFPVEKTIILCSYCAPFVPPDPLHSCRKLFEKLLTWHVLRMRSWNQSQLVQRRRNIMVHYINIDFWTWIRNDEKLNKDRVESLLMAIPLWDESLASYQQKLWNWCWAMWHGLLSAFFCDMTSHILMGVFRRNILLPSSNNPEDVPLHIWGLYTSRVIVTRVRGVITKKIAVCILFAVKGSNHKYFGAI